MYTVCLVLTYYREQFDAVHETKDEYHYRIGVCVDVDDDHPGCAVMQYEKAGDGRAFCAGRVNNAQIARSETQSSRFEFWLMCLSLCV